MEAKHFSYTTTTDISDALRQEQIDSSQLPDSTTTIMRRNANYPLSHWTYERIQSIAIDSQEEDEKRGERIERLKGEVSHLLKEEKDMFQQLELVDALVQLGVSYHFEKELHDILTCIQGGIAELISIRPGDLHAISQLFRVLRDFGIAVSQDVFKGFREDKGGFKAGLSFDHIGMLSLYEASFLGMVGEGTMDEAREFTAKHLGELLAQQGSDLDPHFKLRLVYALELPIHWRITRLHARWFIYTYEEMDGRNPRILELAKLDFNAVQNIYKKELKHLSRWWNDLSLVGEKASSSFRCRLMESLYWAVGFAPEPKFQRCRIALAKMTCLITLWDDCYDIYGTPDELELFTQAIHGWDESLTKELPKCMKMIFLAMLNYINDVGYEMLRDKGVDVILSLKASVVALSDGYHQEAKWYHSGYTPSMEEYMNNAWITDAGLTLATFAYCTSEDITQEAVGKYELYTNVIRWSSMISRLVDDLATAASELARGDVPKSVQCYMFENGGSEAMAREHINHLIIHHWKLLNTYPIPKSVGLDSYGSFLLGLPRISHIIYQYGDGYGQPNLETKERIESLVMHPIPI